MSLIVYDLIGEKYLEFERKFLNVLEFENFKTPWILEERAWKSLNLKKVEFEILEFEEKAPYNSIEISDLEGGGWHAAFCKCTPVIFLIK